jgi:hypothetical protein
MVSCGDDVSASLGVLARTDFSEVLEFVDEVMAWADSK